MSRNHIKIILLLAIFSSLTARVAAQETENSADDEFENYGRNPKFTTTPKPPIKPKKTPPPIKKTLVKKTPVFSKPATIAAVGKPGMKIWAERQIGCNGAFSRVAPATNFESGDCIRFLFRLNFEGYLMIFYRGASGAADVIFSGKDQSNKIAPKTSHLIPGNKGWEFDENVGDEELLFIVSRNPLADESIRKVAAVKDFEGESEVSVQASDRDLIKPKTEKDSVYVLANDARLAKPLVFRMTLKHR